MKSLAPLQDPPFDNFLWAALNVSPTEILNPKTEDESVGDFVSRATSPELADDLVSAIFHGIYAGDIYKLSKDALMPMVAKGFRECGSPLVYFFKEGLKHRLGFKEKNQSHDRTMYESLIARNRPDDVEILRDSIRGSSVITLQEGMKAISEALSEKLSAASNVDVKYNAHISRISHVADDRLLNVRTVPSLCFEPGGMFAFALGRSG
jgi:oxygen-dependent protoporphyrinogen oxidase